MRWLGVGLILIISGVSSCRVDDGDRCHGDLHYNKALGVCESTPLGDTGDSGTSTGAEDRDAGTPAFGSPCFADGDCWDEVDYCLLNPLAPADPGMCTILCQPGDCPEALQCCDCTIWGRPAACMLDDGAAEASNAGCTCS